MDGILYLLSPRWCKMLDSKVQNTNQRKYFIVRLFNFGLDNYRHEHFKCFLDKQVWVYAAAQVFNSIGIAFGLLISFASYNKFHGPILRDTLIVVLVDALTCILCGIIVFATMGNLAFTQGKYCLIVMRYYFEYLHLDISCKCS